MKFLDAFKFLTGRKGNEFRSAIMMQTGSHAVTSPRNYETFASEGYQKNIIAYRCVNTVAQGCAGIPWVLYEKGSKKRTEIEEHPLLDLLLRPKPQLSGEGLIEALISYKMIAGNAYLLATDGTDPTDPVSELWPMRPDQMAVIPGNYGIPAGYRYTRYVDSVKEVTDYMIDPLTGKGPILHIKTFHPTNSWYGLSPIEASLYGIDAHNESGRMYLSLLQNQARPSGALVVQGNLSSEQYERMKIQMEEQYQGARNTGRPMLLEGGTEWKGFGFSPSDLAWIEGKNTNARDIALAFGVPPMLLGIPGDNTYANYKEARLALYEENILPVMNLVRGDLNNWLVPRYGDNLELDYDKDKIDALGPKRETLWTQVSTATDLTINEKREAKGYEAIEGGDIILVSTTQTTLEAVNALLEDTLEPNFEDPNDEDDEDTDDTPEGDDDYENVDPDDSGDQVSAGRIDPWKDVKIVNLRSKIDRRREVLRSAGLKKKLETSFRTQLKSQFKTEGQHLKRVLSTAHPSNLINLAKSEIDNGSKYFSSIIESHIQKIASTFGTRTLRGIKNAGITFEMKSASSTYDQAIREWIRKRAGLAVTSIEETSKERVINQIREVLESGVDEGFGYEPVGKAIEEIYAGFSDYRSQMIARTETGVAANYASREAAKSTGVIMRKEWIASGDERTRGFGGEWGHAEADGQIVGMDEKFRVRDISGDWSEMDGPGDESAPADQVINCRCADGFLSEGEE